MLAKLLSERRRQAFARSRLIRWLLQPYYFFSKSLYRKIWFCFFITISITVAALGLDNYRESSADIKQRAIGNMAQISNQSAATLESYMANVKNFAWEYFSDKDFQKFVDHMGSDADAFSHYMSKFNQFVVDNPAAEFIVAGQLDGYKLYSGNISKINQSNFDFDRLKTIAVEHDGKGVWLPTVAKDPANGEAATALVFAQAIKRIDINSNMPIVGVLFIQLSPEYLMNWLGKIGNQEQGRYALVDSASKTVMLSADEAWTGSTLKGMDSLFRFGYGTSSRYLYGDDAGVRTLFVSNRLQNTSLALVGKVPLPILLKQVNRLALRTLLIGIACLLGAMLIASLLARKIITPLKLLKKGIISIEKGNYEVSVPIRSRDEIGYFIRRFNQMAKEINMLIVKVYEADLIKKDAEIKSLQSQINPHFLYNTLGMIDSLGALHEDDRISLVSSSLAQMFRYNISAGHLSTLRTEVRQLENYFAIQKIRFADRLQYTIEVEEELETLPTPKLLLQPLVENAFIHGIDHLSERGEIRIRAFSLSDTDAAITVWNNGPPIEPDRRSRLQAMLDQSPQQPYAANTASSIGLFNVQARIKLVYGSEYGLTIESDEACGTTMKIRVKKISREESADEDHDRG